MNITKTVRYFTLVLFSFLISVVALAQEKSAEINVDINKDGGSTGGAWYNQPLVWIIGAAVFILLLVALLRGNNTARD
jgi:hypothetical protein